jgi:hypothetical protein
VPYSVTGTVAADGGRVRVTVTDARANGLPLPADARQAIQQSLQNEVDTMVASAGLRVRSVTVGGGRLTVTGSRP